MPPRGRALAAAPLKAEEHGGGPASAALCWQGKGAKVTPWLAPAELRLPVLRTRSAALIGRGQRHAGSVQPSAIDLPLSVWPSGSDRSPHWRSVESRVSRR